MSFKTVTIPSSIARTSALWVSRSALIAATAAGTLAQSAQAGFPTVFGKINVSLNQYSLEKNNFPEAGKDANGATTYAVKGGGTTDELDNWSVESNSSRIGVSGDFGLSYDLKAIYRLEYGTKVDNGSSGGQVFSQRNIWGGIEGDFGRVIAGKNDTPLKSIQTNSVLKSDFDRFNDLPLADIGTYLVGEVRADNIVQYSSPILLGGLELNLAAVQIEESGIENPKASPPKQNDNGFASGYSASAVYGKSNWYLGVGYDNNVSSTDTVRALGEVVLGPVVLGALYQTAERHDETVDVLGGYSSFVGASLSTKGVPSSANPLLEWDGSTNSNPQYKKQEGYVVNGMWKVTGPWSVKAQYATSTSTPIAAFAKAELTDLALGVDFKLNENAKIYSYFASLKSSGDAQINTNTNKDQTLALGLDLKF